MNISSIMPDRLRPQRVWVWIASFCLIAFSICCFEMPAIARTFDDGSLPTRILEVADPQSGLPATRVLLPDWNQISLSQMPGITRSGSIDGKPYIQALGYDLSRSWNTGMSPDQYLKLGDISEAFQPEVFSLEAIAQLTNLDLDQVALSAFTLAAEQTLSHLAEVVPELAKTPVREVAPIAALLAAKAGGINVSGQTLAEVLAISPQAGQLQLREIDLSSFPVTSIPNLKAVQLQQFEGWMNSFVEDVPGLGHVPLGAMPNPSPSESFANAELGSLVMRIDQVYGPAEAQRNNTISGSDLQGFSVPCAGDCPYIELDDLENAGRNARGSLEGKQWISGKYQEVEGGWGTLRSVNGGREPTGRLPFGSAFKVAVMEPDETSDTVDTALFFRFCANALGCTPYFIGPVPFFTYKANALIFVGDLSNQRVSPISQPTGAIKETEGSSTNDSNPRDDSNPCSLSNVSQTRSDQPTADVDLRALAEAIASVESAGSRGYQAIGVHTCADGGQNCGRGLGRYQFMSYNPYAAQLIAAKPEGQAFLNRVEQGYHPTEAELFQFFPPADQDRALMADFANKFQVTQMQIDPTTGQPFTGDRLIERVAQKHFGGDYSQVDGDGSDALGRLNLRDYGQAALSRYQAEDTLTCAPASSSSSSSTDTENTSTGNETSGQATGTLANPAPNFPVTSEFVPRDSPCAGCSNNHRGIDIGTPEGTPVQAADGGQVVYAGWAEGYGNTVIIDHGNGRQTRYAHLSSMNVAVGTAVDQGQQIADSGMTGLGTGPHLHFEVRTGTTPGQPFSGTAVNPRQYVNF
jgi:murein DD-endopeptidase MepM/ murein hydrolase activator NlpD